MTIAYSASPNEKMKVSGSEQDKKFWVVGFNIQQYVSQNWTIDGQLTSERGKNSDNLTASLMLRKVW